MQDLFMVYDLKSRKNDTLTFDDVCKKYPGNNLNFLKGSKISVISIYKSGEKIAVINRIKEDEND